MNPDGSKGFTWNPVVGCKNNCWYCYARKFAKRQKCELCKTFTPHLHGERLDDPSKHKKPATIFIGSMCDLWGDWVDEHWIDLVLDVVRACPQHTFLALTKNPRRYLDFDIPENMWCGVTVTGDGDPRWDDFFLCLPSPQQKKFISFEPLLSPTKEICKAFDYCGSAIDLDQIIIGPLNHKERVTKREWILNLTNIVPDGVPVWHKSGCEKQGLLQAHEMRRELAWTAPHEAREGERC